MTRHTAALEWVPTSSLRPYARNARTHPKAQIRRIADSIARFGFNNPILVGDDAEVIAGHGRLEAARLLDLPSVPTLRLSHLSTTERRAYGLADNKLAQSAGWDRERLVLELQDLIDVNFSVELTGFTPSEVDVLGTKRPHGRAHDKTPAGTPVRAFGHHRLVCGSAADEGVLANLLASPRGMETIDLVMGAPPPGADAREAIAQVLRAVEPHSGPATVAILYAHLRRLVTLVRAGASSLVDPARGRTLPRLPAVAMLVHARNDAAPELGEALAACSPESAIILDPFARTAVIMLAAETTGRCARLVCPDPDTAEKIVAEWKARSGS